MIHPHKKIFVSLDVTFFENTSFLQKTSLQRENDNEASFLDFDFGTFEIENTTSSLVLSPNPSTKPLHLFHYPNHSETPCIESNLNSKGDVETQNNREMLVYSRRSKSKHRKNLMSQEPMIALNCHKSPVDTGISKHDLPIALRK